MITYVSSVASVIQTCMSLFPTNSLLGPPYVSFWDTPLIIKDTATLISPLTESSSLGTVFDEVVFPFVERNGPRPTEAFEFLDATNVVLVPIGPPHKCLPAGPPTGATPARPVSSTAETAAEPVLMRLC